MKQYVLGFLFDDNFNVWLIEKTRPEWQKGKLNGIGGHIEEGETPSQAMVREFKEETGVDLEGWEKYCVLTDEKEYEVHCFFAHSMDEPKTITDEKVGKYKPDALPYNIIPNLYWLIPMAVSFGDIECKPKPYLVKESWPIEDYD